MILFRTKILRLRAFIVLFCLKVRAGVYGRVMAGSGLAAAANWTTSDLMGLGWLAGTLDMDTLARIPARSMDGVRGVNL